MKNVMCQYKNIHKEQDVSGMLADKILSVRLRKGCGIRSLEPLSTVPRDEWSIPTTKQDLGGRMRNSNKQ